MRSGLALLACVAVAGCADGSPSEPVCPPPTADAPDDVFCIGLYRGADPTRIASGVEAYKPGVVLWSDGAEKQRYLLLPPHATIDTSRFDAWQFPVGTKAFKEFRFGGKLVETRMLWKQAADRWVAATYIWDVDQSAAARNTNPKPTLLDSGYEIPTAKDCDKCHHGGSDTLLGVEAVALALPTAEGQTLAALVDAGRLSHPPAVATVALPEDDTGKAAAALGYLHANCGMPCHSARGLGDETQLLLRLRADQFWSPDGAALAPTVATSDAYVVSVGVAPTTASVHQLYPDAKRITPGAHEQSLLWLLSHLRGNYQMPPLVSHVVDEVGTRALADWIDGLR